jgi:carbonic anhydrase
MKAHHALLVFSALVLIVAGGAGPGPGVSPDEALQQLKTGNAQFLAGENRHPRANAQRVASTAQQGQHPVACILSCSDSRVPPEIIFGHGVGDLFVVRVAGNVCGDDELGSLEYGVDHLEAPLLVVMGHTGCGAVTAAVTGAELHGHVAALIDHIRPAVAAAQRLNPQLSGAELVPAAIQANVWESIRQLLKQSPIVRQRVAAGKLKVVGAVYAIEDGKVQWLDQFSDQARLLRASATGSDAPRGVPAAAVH